MSFVSAIITGTIFFIVLTQKVTFSTIFLGVLVSLIAYMFTKPVYFERFPILVLKLFFHIPKAVLEAVSVLASHKARKVFEMRVKDEWEELEKTLTITLTPKTLVVVSEEGYMVVHRMGEEE
ncbi:Na+/H+ antiporter subunit E [Thermotoga sp. KOL6]|uniref:Na+/H+ antiporter subunit E n=1 Tax=Thermotoga sp. KOL6 TaxID=126741 RepID=UPI000C769C7D|nr:Na+/H+ antiporter subunit E [Thermotoga sp. KOL6]PLV59843.1 hypothetical protein AS005_00640 [Thermotoga sp. KOL6]